MYMKKLLWILLFLGLSASFLSGCSKKETEENEDIIFINDPRIPGGSLGENGTIKGVLNVAADTSVFNRITLTWTIPSLFETQDWQVVIYKVKDDGPSADIEIEDPSTDLGAVVFEIIRLKDTTYIDNNISQNQGYYYWIFLNVDGGEVTGDQSGLWSESPKYRVTTPMEDASITFPPADEFWEKIRWSDFVSEPFSGEPRHNFQTLEPVESTIESPAGRLQVGFGGTALFFSDTPNNRILVFEDVALRACEEFEDDEFMYFACRLGALGQRANPYNILGQPHDSSTLSCQEHNDNCNAFADSTECVNTGEFCRWDTNSSQCLVKADSCLTAPTDLLIKDNTLLVADSGNDRVLLYNELFFDPPNSNGDQVNKKIIGCDPEIIPTRITPTKCEANKVFGKKSIFDLDETYDLAFDGVSILDNPTGLAIHNGDLYIADTNNNRVVKAREYEDPSSYLCTDGTGGSSLTWKTPLCSWHAVLGQKNFTSKESLQSFFDDDNTILKGTFSNTLEDDPTLLARYFANPSKLKFYKYAQLPLRTTLQDRGLWTDFIRDSIISANGDLTQILDIPDDIKTAFPNSSQNIVTKLLISANDNFEEVAGLGTQVALKGRILIFDGNIIDGTNPVCNLATFNTNKCDAQDVMGQETFEKIIIISGTGGGAGTYSSLPYTLEAIGDFDFMGDRLLVTDPLNNNIYTYDTFPNKLTDGYPRTSLVENPQGAFGSNNQSLPDLESISGIQWDSLGGKLYVIDIGNNRVYQLDFTTLPGDLGGL